MRWRRELRRKIDGLPLGDKPKKKLVVVVLTIIRRELILMSKSDLTLNLIAIN